MMLLQAHTSVSEEEDIHAFLHGSGSDQLMLKLIIFAFIYLVIVTLKNVLLFYTHS